MWSETDIGVGHQRHTLSFTFSRHFGTGTKALSGARTTDEAGNLQSFFYKELVFAPEYFTGSDERRGTGAKRSWPVVKNKVEWVICFLYVIYLCCILRKREENEKVPYIDSYLHALYAISGPIICRDYTS